MRSTVGVGFLAIEIKSYKMPDQNLLFNGNSSERWQGFEDEFSRGIPTPYSLAHRLRPDMVSRNDGGDGEQGGRSSDR